MLQRHFKNVRTLVGGFNLQIRARTGSFHLERFKVIRARFQLTGVSIRAVGNRQLARIRKRRQRRRNGGVHARFRKLHFQHVRHRNADGGILHSCITRSHKIRRFVKPGFESVGNRIAVSVFARNAPHHFVVLVSGKVNAAVFFVRIHVLLQFFFAFLLRNGTAVAVVFRSGNHARGIVPRHVSAAQFLVGIVQRHHGIPRFHRILFKHGKVERRENRNGAQYNDHDGN